MSKCHRALRSLTLTLGFAANACASSRVPPGQGPAATPSPVDSTIVAAGTGQQVNDYLRAASDLGFDGIVMIARGSDVLLNSGYRWADRERGIPFSATTAFPLASVAKEFYGGCHSETRGPGQASRYLVRYFPDWPADKRSITLHQLLTHTSGLPLDVGKDEEAIGREELLKRAARAALVNPPGSRWSYSNLGYSVLG